MKLGLKGFTDQDLVEGGDDAQRQAREDLRRQQRLYIAMQSGMQELPRSDLVDAHLGLLEYVPTGEYFLISRGEQTGDDTTDTFDAFYIDPAGDVVFLERPQGGPQSRAQLEAHRATRRP